MNTEARLQTALAELEKNRHHLGRYASRVRELAQSRPEVLSDPDDSQTEAIDQFVFRFLKTVDAVTRRLFPSLLARLGEYDDAWSLIDVLNRLEKLGWIQSAADWRVARERRNQLMHEYPDAPEIRRALLVSALDLTDRTLADCNEILKRLR